MQLLISADQKWLSTPFNRLTAKSAFTTSHASKIFSGTGGFQSPPREECLCNMSTSSAAASALITFRSPPCEECLCIPAGASIGSYRHAYTFNRVAANSGVVTALHIPLLCGQATFNRSPANSGVATTDAFDVIWAYIQHFQSLAREEAGGNLRCNHYGHETDLAFNRQAARKPGATSFRCSVILDYADFQSSDRERASGYLPQ